MLSLFERKTALSPLSAAAPAVLAGSLRPESAAALLATPRRQKLLTHIWQRTSMSRRQFRALYLDPLHRYAELVQQMPASESHHHAYAGGMLDHGLEIVAYALKLRQPRLLPAGTTPEDQAAQSEAWTAATAYAALLHDIGKIAVDLHVEYEDGTVWHPWHGPLRRPYRFRYRKAREYRLHSAAGGLLYAHVLKPAILDWLSGYPDLWAPLLYVLAGQLEHAGTLGELVIQADQASVAQAMGGDPSQALAVPRHALQRKLLDGLRYLLREGTFKLNQPQASDGWLTQDALWLVSKTVSDALRAHLLSQGMEGIPSSNTTLFNVLQEHGIALPTPEDKAIWTCTVTSETGWSHSFTLLRLSPALIWNTDERPTVFAGTVRVASEPAPARSPPVATEANTGSASAAERSANPPVMSETSAPPDGVDSMLALLGSAEATPASETASDETSLIAPANKTPPSSTAPSMVPAPTPVAELHTASTPVPGSGDHFLAWLKRSIQSRKLIINDAKALVHTVADTAYLVTPGLFQRYAQEHPSIAVLAKAEGGLADWTWSQKRFEKLKVHRKQVSGLNIWTCQVNGPRKSRQLHGYLLENPTLLFDEVPPNNPYLSLALPQQRMSPPPEADRA